MCLPENCVRGIFDVSFLPDGIVGSHLFHFTGPDRGDGWKEQSINWQDDDSTIEFTLNQRREGGELLFKAGVVILPRADIDRLNSKPAVNGVLSYERQRLVSNDYHGNLLLRSNVLSRQMKLIAAGLALAVSEIISQHQE
jgi:hypothetical protein